MATRVLNHDVLLKKTPGKFNFTGEKWGVLFLNMGGPETLDDIEPFLFNLFSDRNIIKLPLSFLFQKPLAKFISSRRAARVRSNYEAIGGGSPLLKWCCAEASGVRKLLAQRYPRVETYVGMKYTRPYIKKALDRAAADGCRHLVVAPLYPQYTLATTGTALEDIAAWLEGTGAELSLSLIFDWHDHPAYIALLQERISRAMTKVRDRDKAVLLFSAHSLPVKMIERGDPYYDQIKETVRLAAGKNDYLLSFQSRSGPVKWLGPETATTIAALGRRGVKEIVIVPVSFVSDHIETLYEIDIELKEIAMSNGVENFIRTDSFNDDPAFIRLLTDMVLDKIAGMKGA
ncbi:MAG: ferrochelatase [Candidatus Zixiibacteriota bacterium]